MTDYNEDDDGAVAEKVRRTVEASSLGTKKARALRAQVSDEEADALVARVRARLAAAGLPGGGMPAPGQADAGVDDVAQEGAGESVSELDKKTRTETPSIPPAVRLADEEIGTLVEEYFDRPGADDLASWAPNTDPRRTGVLMELATCIEEVTGFPARDITEDQRFRDDLGLDSVGAIEIATLMEDTFARRMTAVRLDGVSTVGDVVNLILCHQDGGAPASPAAEAPMNSTNGSAPAAAEPPKPANDTLGLGRARRLITDGLSHWLS